MSAGWTNDFMTMVHMLHLAQLTQRIPILPPFGASHIGRHKPPIPFGEIFDIPRLSVALGTPILEWRDVKKQVYQGGELDEPLGCWSTWSRFSDGVPRENDIAGNLSLGTSCYML